MIYALLHITSCIGLITHEHIIKLKYALSRFYYGCILWVWCRKKIVNPHHFTLTMTPPALLVWQSTNSTVLHHNAKTTYIHNIKTT